jgi:hypothetical protein
LIIKSLLESVINKADFCILSLSRGTQKGGGDKQKLLRTKQ